MLTEEQQRIRRGRIGASQAAWLFGLGYNGEGWGELYLDLLGKLPSKGMPKDPAALVRDPRWQGFNMEGYAARAFEAVHESLHFRLSRDAITRAWPNLQTDEHCGPWGTERFGPFWWSPLCASPDGLVRDPMGMVLAGWECKLTKRKKDYHEDLIECDFGTVSDGWGEEGTDQVPFRYAIQCQQNMLVAGLDTWHLTLIHNADPYFYVIRRNQAFIDDLIDRAYRFYFLHFLAGVPPPATGATQQRLLGLTTPDNKVYLEADERGRKIILDLMNHEGDMKAMEERGAEIKTVAMEHMKQLAGESGLQGITSPDAKLCWVRGKDGRSFVRLYRKDNGNG